MPDRPNGNWYANADQLINQSRSIEHTIVSDGIERIFSFVRALDTKRPFEIAIKDADYKSLGNYQEFVAEASPLKIAYTSQPFRGGGFSMQEMVTLDWYTFLCDQEHGRIKSSVQITANKPNMGGGVSSIDVKSESRRILRAGGGISKPVDLDLHELSAREIVVISNHLVDAYVADSRVKRIIRRS